MITEAGIKKFFLLLNGSEFGIPSIFIFRGKVRTEITKF